MKHTAKQFFKVLTLFSLIFISTFVVIAQPCSVSGNFQNQSQIDSFNLLNPGCTIIHGDLVLSGSDISNIDSLYKITEIRGGLRVHNSGIKELKGLSKVKNLRYISLRSNDLLSNISSFDSLISIKDSFMIADCPQLESISVFPILSSVARMVVRGRTDKLKRIVGFDSLRIMNNGFIMDNNFGVEEINGFHNVGPIDFSLSNNHHLKTVIGFNGYVQVCSDTTSILQDGVFLGIFRNDSLQTFDGLHNVECFGRFHIWENFHLKSVNVARNTKKVSDFSVQYNFMLNDIQGFNKVYAIHSNGFIDINNNDSLNQIHIFKELRKVHRLIISETQAKSFNESFINLDTIGDLRNLGMLVLLSNRKLTDISVFNDLKYTDEIIILDNRLLGECSIESICNHIKAERYIEVWITNYPGCRSVNQILAKCKVYLEEEHEDNVIIFPNPASEIINIKRPSILDHSPLIIVILDIAGREMLRKNVDLSTYQDTYVVDISNLAQGSYQVVLLGDRFLQPVPLIKI